MCLQTIKCPCCGTELPGEASFCPHCAQSVNRRFRAGRLRAFPRRMLLLLPAALAVALVLLAGFAAQPKVLNGREEVRYTDADGTYRLTLSWAGAVDGAPAAAIRQTAADGQSSSFQIRLQVSHVETGANANAAFQRKIQWADLTLNPPEEDLGTVRCDPPARPYDDDSAALVSMVEYTARGDFSTRICWTIQMDNGFFGWTREATIKNINFKDCYVGSTYRGGLVAGYAQDTFFLNILTEDCTTSIIPSNNVLNLITNAGISGGTIAGVANGCTLYNCEMRAGRVVTNSTAGVAALGGQPLYMGGLVGQANDAIIEYCRVTDKWVEKDDGTRTRTYAEVKGTYETAVSVANYSEVFVGGIVGCMQNEDTGTKIIDCYSTADVYGKAAIYFGVGLGLGIPTSTTSRCWASPSSRPTSTWAASCRWAAAT